MRDRQQIRPDWLALLLSFVLTLLLVFLTVITVCTMTLSNQSYLKAEILKSGFCGNVKQELEENFTSYGTPGGFSREIMGVALNEDQIQTDMFRAVERLYAGDRGAVEYPALQEKLFEALTEDLIQRGYQITPQISNSLEEIVKSCTYDYGNYVTIPFSTYLVPVVNKLQKVIVGASLLVIVGITAVVLLLFFKNRRRREVIPYYFWGTAGAAIVTMLMPIAANLTWNLNQLSITPLSFKQLVVHYAKGLISAFWYLLFLYVVVLVALGVMEYTRIQKKKNAASKKFEQSAIYSEAGTDEQAFKVQTVAEKKLSMQPQIKKNQ